MQGKQGDVRRKRPLALPRVCSGLRLSFKIRTLQLSLDLQWLSGYWVGQDPGFLLLNGDGEGLEEQEEVESEVLDLGWLGFQTLAGEAWGSYSCSVPSSAK